VIKLLNALEAWGTPDFENALKGGIQQIDTGLLPLQEGLSQSSHVSEGDISVVILSVTEASNVIRAKTGIIYAGIIAGSCCADDPTPMSEQTEYCEVQFDINKMTAETTVTIL
jgi:hypothetical protein